jgi:hypothetical protein
MDSPKNNVAISRTQKLVLGFFVLARARLVAIYAAAPEVHGRDLGLSSADARLLFLMAFLFGSLRVVASALALSRVLPADGPTWYALCQALLQRSS